MNPNSTSTTPSASKPRWVDALEVAERNLVKAENAKEPEAAHAFTAIAHSWMDVARMYRDNG